MKCPCCHLRLCDCFGINWRLDWSIQEIHDRCERDRKDRLAAVMFFWLSGKRPTRKQLMELPRSQKP